MWILVVTSFEAQVWADVTNDLLSQNNGAGADLLGITGYMSPQGTGRALKSLDLHGLRMKTHTLWC